MKKILMKRLLLLLPIFFFAIWICIGDKTSVAGGLSDNPKLFSELAKKILPAIVSVNNGVGTGVIVGSDGYLITNRHVYDIAYPFKVRLYDGREFIGKLINKSFVFDHIDPDIALIKIDGENLPYLPLGDSDKLKVGDIVAAVGNFYGLPFSFTAGMVNGLHRKIPEVRNKNSIKFFSNYIQHSAAANKGSSGGPIVNLDGEVVGINSHIIVNYGNSSWQGITFAIPINDVVKFLKYKRSAK